MSHNVIDVTKTALFAVTDPELITIDYDKLAKQAAERRKASDAARAADMARLDPAQALRDEFDELERRVKGQPTEQQAKQYADEQAKTHAATIKIIKDRIAYVKSLLDSPAVTKCRPLREGRIALGVYGTPIENCGCDHHVLSRQIASLEDQLSEAKRASDKSVRLCGASIKNAREVDKLRPRYEELRRTFSQIDHARQEAIGLQRDSGFKQELITTGDHFHQKSRHLRWEP